MITDDLIYHLVASVTIDERNRGAEYDFLAGELRDVDNLRARQAVLDFANLNVEERLAIFRSMEFGIFREVAVFPRLFDFANVLWTLDAFQALHLVNQSLIPPAS